MGQLQSFIKKLFAKEEDSGARLAPNFWDLEDQGTREQNELLIAPFTQSEIKDAVFSCYAEGAPGPYGLPFLFYHKFWNVVKGDIVALFQDFHKGSLDLYRLNFPLVTLIPTVCEATNMKHC